MAALPPKKKQRKRNPAKGDVEKLERLDSLRWTTSLPDVDDDPFSAFAGLSDFEGCVLSFEEIDESEYGLELPKVIQNKEQKKQTKWKLEESNSDEVTGEDIDGELVKEVKKNKKKKKKTKKAKKPKGHTDTEDIQLLNELHGINRKVGIDLNSLNGSGWVKQAQTYI